MSQCNPRQILAVSPRFREKKRKRTVPLPRKAAPSPREPFSMKSFPIKDLPFDILIKVFFWASLGTDSFASLEPTSSPNNIASVCRLWRDIALSTPGLWSNVSLPQCSDARPIHLGKVKAYLKKSKDAPLSIYLCGCRDSPLLYELLMLINENRRRCEVVDIGLPRNYNVPDNFLDLGDMPLIEHFRLTNSHWRSELNLSNTPHLTTLYHSYDSRFELCLGETPLRNLTEVRLGIRDSALRGGLSAAACIELLKAAQQLEILSMMIFEADETDPSAEEGSYPVIHLPQLYQIELFHETWSGISHLRRVLQLIQAPELKSVDVGILDRGPEDDNGDCGIIACLERTQPNEGLTRFVANDMLVSELAQCLPLAPNLTCLAIDLSYEWHELFDLLTFRANSPIRMCPKLRSLDLRYYDPIDEEAPYEPVVNMVLSLWNPPNGQRYLEEFAMGCSTDDFVLDRRIVRCIREGLQVTIFPTWQRGL